MTDLTPELYGTSNFTGVFYDNDRICDLNVIPQPIDVKSNGAEASVLVQSYVYDPDAEVNVTHSVRVDLTFEQVSKLYTTMLVRKTITDEAARDRDTRAMNQLPQPHMVNLSNMLPYGKGR